MIFECSYLWEDGTRDNWKGTIDSIIEHDNYYELFIISRSSIHLIFGKYSRGIFAVSPEFGGTYLSSNLDDVFYNTEQLTKVFGNIVDGFTTAKALAFISNGITFNI